ncbi:MAG: DUF1512 domain-containing protein [Thaumarchaeota archaeon]|nr:DUF1512 domain-containing protein [Nitrososphaerota archaeon]MBI3023477.1 DUF1512 domain-containing protein [Nitrososphaerota archaeon]MBI3116333.1 DUF1512 domain-containing protein [Nitrososphaerota archaeon]
MLYGQRIQIYMIANDVSRGLNRLKLMKERSRKETIDYFANSGKPAGDPTERIDQFLDYVTIMPVDLDPNGLVGKIEHITGTRDERSRAEVKKMLPTTEPVGVSVAENILEVATALNMIHKIVRHYYLLGKKTNSYFLLVQLQMIMPLVLQEADALINAVDTFKLNQPIGDGIGPVIASRYMLNQTKQNVAKDTVMAITEYKGRTLYVLKAEGPMGYVGQPGVALQRLVEEMNVSLNAIIMVDAALKLEGEKTGDIAEGIGAAIGGIGVDKFQIEEVAAKHKIPLYAVLIKQSILEAITVMRKEIAEASDKVVSTITRVIEEKTKEGDKILLAGIGNSLGVGQ